MCSVLGRWFPMRHSSHTRAVFVWPHGCGVMALRWPTSVVLVVVVLAAVLCCAVVEAKKKHCLLHAEQGLLVEDFVEQPSGLTFSHRTKRLYMICDTGHCNYIFEFNEDGEYMRKLEFTKSHKDVEAVACFDEAGLLYIGEESKRKVTAFFIPEDETVSTSGSAEEYSSESSAIEGISDRSLSGRGASHSVRETAGNVVQLEEAFHFTVEAPEESTLNNGLEGLTVNDRTGHIFCTNEKEPREIIELSAGGEQLDIRYPEYAKDLSGLCYDKELDLLWVLSDKSEAIYVTNVETGAVYDYWDLDMENPEGVALNNDHDPPLLYISTDPSSPQGAQYVAALFIFIKPEIGTGLGYHDKCSFDDHCVGCDAIKAEAKENQKAFDEQQAEIEAELEEEERKKDLGISLGVVLPSFLLFVVVLAVIIGFALIFKREQLKRLIPCKGRRSPDQLNTFEMDEVNALELEGDGGDLDDADGDTTWLEEGPDTLLNEGGLDLPSQALCESGDHELYA